ncbi:MAG: [FeFe] hydrogenase, group A [Patescibacteria group bacterium]|nr:[FeFe] hydrogenase, group A [Patescibacteria group bacterium]
MQLKIDGKIYDFKKGETILDVCRKNDIKIPTLCFHSDLLPSKGVCRLCLVKTNRHKGLMASCQTLAENMMEVIANDNEIEKARRINLELLWADHAGKCAQCQRNGNCELQKLACDFKIDVDDFVPNVEKFEKNEQLKVLKESLKNRIVDDGNPSIFRDSQYCIECRRCVEACKSIQTIEEYGVNHRSIETSVGTACEMPMDCILCGQCSLYCPTAAITEKDNTDELEKMLADKNSMTIFQVAPSVRFTLGEEFGLEPGNIVESKIPSALRSIGADLVFDTAFSADLTIVEEAHELVEKVRAFLSGDQSVKFPMFTSCCPSWILYVEKFWPQYRDHLSSARSPQQMLGAMIKTYFARKKKMNAENIRSISIMPCTAKKFEAQREEMGRNNIQDIDLVITTREFARYLKKKKIDLLKLEDGEFDKALGIYTGAGIIFGTTGGVMEAALRSAYEELTCEEFPQLNYKPVRGPKGIKEAEIIIPRGKCNSQPITIKVAVAHEIRNAKKILESMKQNECDYHFVEVMACPSGCLGGGGQPIPTNSEIRKKRMEAIYKKDKKLSIRKSHENPAVKKIYEEYLEHPGGERSEKYLHTHYIDRSKK